MISACTGDGTMSELAFARLVNVKRRTNPGSACAGPLVTLDFTVDAVAQMMDALTEDTVARQLWWAGYHPDHLDAMRFSVCAAHGIDFASLLRFRATRHGRPEWHTEARNLLQGLCKIANWDVKELSNMLNAQRVQLT